MTTALIDADSIIYIIAWNFKDDDELVTDAVKQSCDDFVHSILTLTQADCYIGAFSAPSVNNFRSKIYLYQPYKGNRPPKPDFVTKWSPVIKAHLTDKWGFYTSPSLEADDIVVAIAAMSNEETDKSNRVIVCSPDKDLKQVPGYHFDYRTNSEGIQTVTILQACINLWAQVLTGDSTDNIAGLPGLGEVKVRKLFDTAAETGDLNDLTLMQVVQAQFHKYFGTFYGHIIYCQTLQSVMMVQPNHPRWDFHKEEIQDVKTNYVRTSPASDTELDECVLNELGWDL